MQNQDKKQGVGVQGQRTCKTPDMNPRLFIALTPRLRTWDIVLAEVIEPLRTRGWLRRLQILHDFDML